MSVFIDSSWETLPVLFEELMGGLRMGEVWEVGGRKGMGTGIGMQKMRKGCYKHECN